MEEQDPSLKIWRPSQLIPQDTNEIHDQKDEGRGQKREQVTSMRYGTGKLCSENQEQESGALSKATSYETRSIDLERARW